MALAAKEALKKTPKAPEPPKPSKDKPIAQVMSDLEAELRARQDQVPKLEAALQGTKDRINVIVGMLSAYRSIKTQAPAKGQEKK